MDRFTGLEQLEESFTRGLQNHSKHAIKKDESTQQKQQIQEDNQSDEDAETYPNEGGEEEAEEAEDEENDQKSKSSHHQTNNDEESSTNNEKITATIAPFVGQKLTQKLKLLTSSTSRLYNLTNKSMNSTITTTPQAKKLAQQLSPLNFSSESNASNSSKMKSFQSNSTKYMQFINNSRFVNPFQPNDSSNASKKTLTNREENKRNINNTISYSNVQNNSLHGGYSFQTFRAISKQAQNLIHSPSNKTVGDNKGQNESCHEQQYMQNSRKSNTLRLFSLEKSKESSQKQLNGSLNCNIQNQSQSINMKNRNTNDINMMMKKNNSKEKVEQSSSSMLSQSMTSPRMLSQNTSSSLKWLNPSIKESKNYPQSSRNQQQQLKSIPSNSMSLRALPQAATSGFAVSDKQSTPNRSQQQAYEFHQNTQYSNNNATSPSSYLKLIASSPALEEMSENFRSSLSIIDRNEMKKFAIEKELQVVLQPKNEEPEKNDTNIFKSNMPSTEQRLKPGSKCVMLLGMNEFTYFCVKVKGKESPLRLKIISKQLGSFKLLASRESTTPTQFNCDFDLQGNVFSFESLSNSFIFEGQEFFYFALFSVFEATVQVYHHFGSEGIKLHKESSQYQQNSNPTGSSKQSNSNSLYSQKSPGRNRMASEAQDKLTDLSTQQLRDEVKKIYKKRRINHDGGIVNIILKNIEKTQKDQVINLEKLKKETQEVKRTRLQQALEQRTFLFENHINLINAQREEKEIRKQLMLVNKMREIKQFQKSTFAFFWMTNIKIILMVSKFGDMLRYHRERQRLMRDMAFSLTRPFSKYRIKIKKLCGVSIQSRTLVDSYFSVYTYVKTKRQKTKKNAEKALAYCLQANAWRFEVVQKINHYIKTAIKVIHRVKLFHFKVNSFKKLLFRFWEKRYMELIPEIMQVKPEYVPLKDPTLAKRSIQNIYSSFNHLDLKRDAINTYYRTLLHQYIMNIRKYNPSQNSNNSLKKNGTLYQGLPSESNNSNNGGEVSQENENNNKNNNNNSIENFLNSSSQEIDQFQKQQQEQQMYYLHGQLQKQPSIQVIQRQNKIASCRSIQQQQQPQAQYNKSKLLESITSMPSEQEYLISDFVDADGKNMLMGQNTIESNQILERLPTRLETQLIRLFVIPNRSQLKHLIYLEVFAVGQQYPELLKKITFKYP